MSHFSYRKRKEKCVLGLLADNIIVLHYAEMFEGKKQFKKLANSTVHTVDNAKSEIGSNSEKCNDNLIGGLKKNKIKRNCTSDSIVKFSFISVTIRVMSTLKISLYSRKQLFSSTVINVIGQIIKSE